MKDFHNSRENGIRDWRVTKVVSGAFCHLSYRSIIVSTMNNSANLCCVLYNTIFLQIVNKIRPQTRCHRRNKYLRLWKYNETNICLRFQWFAQVLVFFVNKWWLENELGVNKPDRNKKIRWAFLSFIWSRKISNSNLLDPASFDKILRKRN